MQSPDAGLAKILGGKVRARVCGLCWNESRLLLVNHEGLYGHSFWAPPGGGIEYGVSAPEQLTKEFREETGLEVRVGDLLFTMEFIQPPLHAVELFFDVEMTGGSLKLGSDPEYQPDRQVITDVRYFSEGELDQIPEAHCHGLFRLAKTQAKIRALRGYHKI